MQPANAEGLRALYAQVIAVGNELLSLLSGPSPAGGLDRMTELLEERHRIEELTRDPVARWNVPPDALALLQQVVEQQAVIDSGFRSALAELQSQQLAVIIQQGRVQRTQNLLSTGPRSRLLNEYR